MYAIAEISGKQYKVEVGATVVVDKLNAEVGEELTFPVLMSVDGKTIKTGNPTVKNVTVKAKVLEHTKSKKITVFKYKPKKNERKKQGHRQPYSKIEILSIG